MNAISKILIFLLISLILTSCAENEPLPRVEVMITEQPTDQSVGLEAGNVLEVVLPANPSTGYRWEVVFFDQTILRQIGETEFIKPSLSPDVEGDQVFHFEAVKPGETEVAFEYRQPFTSKAEAEKSFSAGVTVLRWPSGFWERIFWINVNKP